MARRKLATHDFDTLKQLGFELEAPQDEFSYQPDSGSVTDGIIGVQEYGINIVLDAEGRGSEGFGETRKLEDPEQPIPGQSEWSQKHRLLDTKD